MSISLSPLGQGCIALCYRWNRMTVQARLIEAYERVRWPRRAPALPDLLKYLMDKHGLTRADIVPLLGNASRVSAVLNGKHELSMTMSANSANDSTSRPT